MDFMIASITMNPSRSLGIDFLLPFSQRRSAIYIKTPTGSEFHWNLFVAPFTVKLWVFLFGLSVFYAVVGEIGMHVSEWCLNSGRSRLLPSVALSIIQTMAFIKSAYFGLCLDLFDKHEPIQPMANGKRLYYFVILLSGYIVFNCYAASLTSELSISTLKLPFRNIEELAQRTNVAVITVFQEKNPIFQSEMSSKPLKSIYLSRMRNKEVYFKSIKKGMKYLESHPNCALYATEHVLEIKATQKGQNPYNLCKFMKVWKNRIPSPMAMSLPKGSPYKKFLNKQIWKTLDSGILAASKQKWMTPKMNCNDNVAIQIGYSKFASLLSALAVSMLISLLLFFGELLLRGRQQSVHGGTERQLWKTEKHEIMKKSILSIVQNISKDEAEQVLHEVSAIVARM